MSRRLKWRLESSFFASDDDLMNILVLNCGSSSVKFAVLQLTQGKSITSELILNGQVEKIGTPETFFKAKFKGEKVTQDLGQMDQTQALHYLLRDYLSKEMGDLNIDGIGHRVVHGGEHFTASTLITQEVLDTIRACNPLAPLHNPANLLGIELSVEVFGDLPQVAVFDTAFHQSIPPAAFRYAIPQAWYKEHGIRRYGFHGSSHRYVSQKFAEVMEKDLEASQVITVHLGNGSSATAIKNGKSVDTTMGFTPLEGLVMGTRSGDIDPGIFSYLQEQQNMPLSDIHNTLNKKSGLLGLSGLSSDMQELEANADREDVQLALEVMSHKLAKSIMALAASLERLDAIIFTGGIGENSVNTRLACVQRLKILGLELDEQANANHGIDNRGIISTASSPLICVIPTDEESMIAMDTASLI
jgi:acetate kinase